MAPVPACANPPDLTCDDLKDIEEARAQHAFEVFCRTDMAITDILQAFIFPPWVTDADDQRKALINYITRHALCRPTNNAAVDCDDEEPCLDPQPNFCPDPDQCPSKWYGYGLLEVIQAAIRADSMTYVPIKGFGDLVAGEPLVWDPTATPDNPNCDPCAPNVLGAMVPQHVWDLGHPDV